MINAVPVESFLEMARSAPILDVRTPAEFARGHIPGAVNLPLFSDDERATVGTVYKRRGRNEAVLLGLDLAGPRLRTMVETVQRNIDGRHVLLHCWRGGMRSGSVAWLLDLCGFRVATLQGGYKAYRRFALAAFDVPRSLRILGGKTGSGKTQILHALARAGEQTVDIELLAHHRGSSFGSIGGTIRPTQEQFENDLALQLYRTDPSIPLWIEDESRRIGWVQIPEALWHQMRAAQVLFLDLPKETRIANLVQEYGKFARTDLADAVTRLTRQIGGLDTRRALEALEQDRLDTVVDIMLRYYDKTYLYGLSLRDPDTVKKITTSLQTPESIANLLIGYGSQTGDAADRG